MCCWPGHGSRANSPAVRHTPSRSDEDAWRDPLPVPGGSSRRREGLTSATTAEAKTVRHVDPIIRSSSAQLSSSSAPPDDGLLTKSMATAESSLSGETKLRGHKPLRRGEGPITGCGETCGGFFWRCQHRTRQGQDKVVVVVMMPSESNPGR